MKKIRIGEGEKYDLTKVSQESVNQEEVTKNKAKLIKIFNFFDKGAKVLVGDGKLVGDSTIVGDGELSSVEMAKAMEYLAQFDENNNGKLSKKELDKALEELNKGADKGEKIKAKDLKEFINNLKEAMSGDPMQKTQAAIAAYEQQQAKIEQEKQNQKNLDEADAAADLKGYRPTSEQYLYADMDKELYAKYDPETKEFKYVQLNEAEDGTVTYKEMTEEQINAHVAEVEDRRAKEAEQEKWDNLAYDKTYVVQPNDRFEEVIKAALAKAGYENPTEEQIQEAKEKFKEANPGAVRTTDSGYEFLNVGDEVKLPAELDAKLSSKDAVYAWAGKNPDLVWKSENQEQLAADITPDIEAEEALGEDLQAQAEIIRQNQNTADGAKKTMFTVLTRSYSPDNQLTGIGPHNQTNHINKGVNPSFDKVEDTLDYKFFETVGNEENNINKDTAAYIFDSDALDLIENKAKNKDAIYDEILNMLKERGSELGLESVNEQQIGKRELIEKLSAEIQAAEQKTLDDTEANQEAVPFLKDNKEILDKSNQTLARVVDLVENEPDWVKKTGTDEWGDEYCTLKDGTRISITRDNDGNITTVWIENPNDNNRYYDVIYTASEIKIEKNAGKPKTGDKDVPYDLKTVKTTAHDFEKIKALAERIFGAKPE